MTKDREARIAKVRAWKLRKHNLRVLTSDNPQAAISELEKLNGELVEVLEWLTFLMNGVGKSGGSPSSAEFEEANKASQEILIRYKQRHANLKKEV